MKNWFVTSIAVMAFLVACGKKEKKQGEIGKTVAGSALDCNGKDKEKDSCKPKNTGTTPPASPDAAKRDETKVSGTDDQKNTTDTFPNQKNTNIMSLHLNENSGIVADFSLSSIEADSKYTSVNILCKDVNSIASNTDDKVLNPDKLQNVNSKIYLFNNSVMLAKLKINNGDGVGEKPFMISCKNGSSVVPSKFKEATTYQIKTLSEGLSTLDLIATSKAGDEGVLTSIQCVSDENFVRDYNESKKVLSDNYVLNRVKLTKGSSILFTRAINMKFEDKKLTEIDAKFKDQKYVIVTCQ